MFGVGQQPTAPDGGWPALNLPNGSMVVINVTDTGSGIAPEDLPRVFDRFYQGTQPGANKLPGSGLGLALAKKVVEAHGGQIGIESEVGKGTTVHFMLPLSPGRQSG